jgi:hypothetical protein
MPLWEFSLAWDDGTALSQTVLAEGVDETEAATSAIAAVRRHSGLVIASPGRQVQADVEARWREVYGDDAFPEIVPEKTRLTYYARGIPDPSAR